jgi:tetratricopeptide (TPR) repeat protein
VIASLTTILITNFYGFSVVNVALIFFILPVLLILDSGNYQEKSHHFTQLTYDFNKLNLPKISAILAIFAVSVIILYKNFQIFQADKFFNLSKAYLSQGQILQASDYIEKALNLNSKEADYYQQKASVASRIAYTIYVQDASGSAQYLPQYINTSISSTQKGLEANPVHLNSYKSASRIYLTLGAIDPRYNDFAVKLLEKATQYAPTDPLLTFNIALIYDQQGNHQLAQDYFLKTVELKPNYRRAWIELGSFYEAQNRPEEAKEVYNFILQNIDPKDEFSSKRLTELD